MKIFVQGGPIQPATGDDTVEMGKSRRKIIRKRNYVVHKYRENEKTIKATDRVDSKQNVLASASSKLTSAFLGYYLYLSLSPPSLEIVALIIYCFLSCDYIYPISSHNAEFWQQNTCGCGGLLGSRSDEHAGREGSQEKIMPGGTCASHPPVQK